MILCKHYVSDAQINFLLLISSIDDFIDSKVAKFLAAVSRSISGSRSSKTVFDRELPRTFVYKSLYKFAKEQGINLHGEYNVNCDIAIDVHLAIAVDRVEKSR